MSALGSFGNLPGVDDNQATVQDNHSLLLCLLKMLSQLIVQCVPPHHVGVAAAAKPAPEIDNQFEEAGGKASPGPATKHVHTLYSLLKTYFKGKRCRPRRGT